MLSRALFLTLALLGVSSSVDARPSPLIARQNTTAPVAPSTSNSTAPSSSSNSTASPASKHGSGGSSNSSLPGCRFATKYSQSDILSDPTNFIQDVMYWEGKFHSNSVGYNTANGMSYDGTLLNETTGENDLAGLHQFSAASKESLQIMVYAHALSGDPLAARFISPDNPSSAPDTVAGIMRTKLATYQKFNETYPGFGGFLPWYANPDNGAIQPTWDWVNRVPALDNGELIWAVYAAVQAMEDAKRGDWADLVQGWQGWLDYTKTTAAKLFYFGEGKVCAVTHLDQTVGPFDPKQNITCEGGDVSLLNDPYEGELFTWWLYFFGGLSDTDKQALWTVKRPQLVSVEYTGSVVDTPWNDGTAYNYSGKPVVSQTIGPITVQRGFWFSAHEQWKLLEMPYRDINIVDRVFHNAERVRTCNSVLMGQNGGLFASVNNITDPVTGQIIGYISAAGIPSISNQTTQEQDIITPYGSFPTVLYDQKVGLAWYKNMLDAKAMQNPYGSSESTRRDGTGASAFVSWDSKISTVNAILGGVSDFTRKKMQKDNVYNDFKTILDKEYTAVFGNQLKGENVDLCLPNFQIPNATVSDFTQCSA